MINLIVRLVDRLFYNNATQILMYHGFCDEGSNQLNTGKHVSIVDFEKQLQYLCKNFSPISISLFLDACKGKATLPPRSIILTFDDGYLSNYALAFPLLKKYQVPAIVYLATEFINNKKLIWVDRVELAIHQSKLSDLGEVLAGITGIKELSAVTNLTDLTRKTNGWLKQHSEAKKLELVKQIISTLNVNEADFDIPDTMKPLNATTIQEMQSSGLVEFGAHTRTHPILSECSDDELMQEITGSIADVKQLADSGCPHFAYPNGGAKDFNGRVLDILQESGIETSVTTMIGENNLSSERYLLKRIGVFQGLSFDQFKTNLQPARRSLVAFKMRVMGVFR